MQIVNKNPIELIPSAYNPREITDVDFEKLKNSIKEFGMVENIVINSKNFIIGGHMRVKACIELGIKEVPCVVVNLTEVKEKLLNLALNRISGRWDNDKLGELITEIGKDEDIKLSGLDEWELDFYNQGPELNPEFENIQGGSENDSAVLIFSFENEKDAQEVSKFLNDGKYIKGMNGQKLLDLVNQVKNA